MVVQAWENESEFGGDFYEPGDTETLLVLDIDGTVVVISSRLFAPSPAWARDQFAAVLDSIHVERE